MVVMLPGKKTTKLNKHPNVSCETDSLRYKPLKGGEELCGGASCKMRDAQ